MNFKQAQGNINKWVETCMWYPLMEIELNLGMFLAVYANISPIIRIECSGG